MTARTTRRSAATSRITAVGAIAVAGTLLLSGCGDQTKKDSGTDTSTKSNSAPLFNKLPKKFQDAGVIEVGTDATYAPMELKQSGTIVGVDPDIAAALGKQLGVTFKFTSGTFDGLLAAMQTGRYGVVMSSVSDTKARQEGLDDKGQKTGKGVDFVDYFTASTGILVKKGNPEHITSVDDLCGKKLAVQRGTTFEAAAKDLSKKCTTGGKAALSIESFPTDAEAQTRVKAGGAVADLNDSPVAAYIAKTAGGGNDFESVANKSDAGPFGIAVDKSNTQLRDAIKLAMDAIIADGSYKAALDKWGAGDGAITKAAINGGS
ncbi:MULTISPECIES: ABC transporter substrate-binding protein [unclassified Streptomyces]|uniref:ABC transporter substrate-binding protein n=1 Tax=unclassified Streptomyces TaxID=2593676 RepID=UPI002033D79F|nr:MULTISPECIES: ABC transporter substrate-binding protein [unclassified Streptomyces]MCM2421554.1 ABC transporter substrate-binding protein [Streptomyces sp. RKAG293]MCM2426240.1 ABC transporter substrate-binding protein [Streptomyces sp. RKAG337]